MHRLVKLYNQVNLLTYQETENRRIWKPAISQAVWTKDQIGVPLVSPPPLVIFQFLSIPKVTKSKSMRRRAV